MGLKKKDWKKPCKLDGCGATAAARGYCMQHYRIAQTGREFDHSLCLVMGCDYPGTVKGMCGAHYARQLRGRFLTAPIQRRPPGASCSVSECSRPRKARSLCRLHYDHWKKHGDASFRPSLGRRRDPNNWFMQTEGYIMAYDQNAGRYRPEHRIVMESALGRPLHLDETVHHVNGDRSDNRPENLELWSTRHCKGQRIDEKIAWCLEFLSRYGEATFTQTRIERLGEKESFRDSVTVQ